MSDSYKKIMNRANVHQLANFALCAAETNEDRIEDYSDEEQKAYKKLEEDLGQYMDEDTLYHIIPIINTYSSRYGDIQFICGMKYISNLLYDLLR